MTRRFRRLATVLTGMALLGVLVAAPGTPATATGASTSALEFAPTDYPVCAFNGSNRTIRYMVDRIVANSPPSASSADPGDSRYEPPTAAARDDFRAGLRALIDDSPATATQRLGQAGYQVCSGDIDSTFFRYRVLVYPVDGLDADDTTGQPALVLAPGRSANATVLSGPHLRAEAHIKNQILDALDNGLPYVRGGVFSGTHRCSHPEAAPGDYQGSTSMCGGEYKRSDMAHNTDTIFQDMHDVLRQEYPQTYQLQLHGMSAAGFSISRGMNPNAGSATHPQDAITRAHSWGSEEVKDWLRINGLTSQETTQFINLTSCSPFVHSVSGIAAPVRKLHCGTKNAQLDREKDLGAEDRFIHLEQSMYIRSGYPQYIKEVMYGLFNE